jgi:uncharacterized membrane protein
VSVDTLSVRRLWPGVPLGGIAAFLIGILFLAGAIHISTILLVPALARNDGWSRLVALAGVDEFAEIRVTGAEAASVVGLDPLFVNGACRLKLADAPAGIAVEAPDRFWSLALYDPQGTIIFSLNDRTAIEGRLDMLVVNTAQNTALKQAPPAGIEQTIVVEALSDELVALLRLFAPTAEAQDEGRSILAAAECLPAPLVRAAGASGG